MVSAGPPGVMQRLRERFFDAYSTASFKAFGRWRSVAQSMRQAVFDKSAAGAASWRA